MKIVAKCKIALLVVLPIALLAVFVGVQILGKRIEEVDLELYE